MLFQHFDCDLTHQVLFLYILPSHHKVWTWETSPEDWKILILWCRTDICCFKLSEKESLMLDNPFPVLSLYKLNHCFIQISTKTTCKQLIPFRESNFFWSPPRCFGPLGKFQQNIKIFIKTARVSRLSFCFLWLWFNWIFQVKFTLKELL